MGANRGRPERRALSLRYPDKLQADRVHARLVSRVLMPMSYAALVSGMLTYLVTLVITLFIFPFLPP